MVPGWFALIGEVLRVRNKFSAKFFEFRPFLSSSVSLPLYETACVFEGGINPQPHRPWMETMKDSTVVRNKLNYTQEIIGARIQPRRSYTITVFPTQMWE